MGIEPHVHGPVARNAPVAHLDSGFEARRDAWVGRGRLHERQAGRKFIAGAGPFAAAAALVHAFLRP